MRTDGLFIGIEIDDDALAATPQLAGHLSQVCPVDIFREPSKGELEIVERNVDECVLCRLCLGSVGGDAVRVLKLYDDGAAL